MSTPINEHAESGTRRAVLGATMAVFAVCVLRTAWIGDDAYITLRTVDNFVEGFGLRYNVAERVQSYTHPLWMLLLSATYFVTHEEFYGTIALSVLTSMLAVGLLVFRVARSTAQAVLAALLLCTSQAFVDYSTSGLENPLTHLLVVCFAWRYLVASGSLLQLSLLSGLLALNRMDTILVVLPALAHAMIGSFRQIGLKNTLRASALGFAPLLCWLVFSLLYYGFLVPNTAFAKLNTGVESSALLRQGIVYLFHTVAWDPATIVILLAGVFVVAAGLPLRERLFALGALLHLIYVVRIGGDFMAGRFLTLAVLMSVCLIARHPGLANARMALTFATPICLALAVGLHSESWPSIKNYQLNGIADERSVYRQHASLMLASRGHKLPNHPWVASGKALKKNDVKVKVIGPAGYLGFSAGRNVHLVDVWGLVDPLIARLPVETPRRFRIGHFTRKMPQGYRRTLSSGHCKMTSAYCKYYAELERIVRGPIWSLKRFVTIIKMNFGAYDHLVEAAKAQTGPMKQAELH